MSKNSGDWSTNCQRSTPQHLKLALVLATGLVALAGCETVSVKDPGEAAGFQNLLDSVVRLDVREASYSMGMKQTVRGVGSGVILDEDGYILTNAHVIGSNVEEIMVTLPNLERVEAELVGWDHWTDLALVRLDMETVRERGLSFSHSEFGDSDSLYPGQTVYAVGTPNGLTRTVTRGIISNQNRYFAASNQIRGYETGYFNTWLQTDAAINPGNSGGPLVDDDGRVVGINTRSYLGSNNLSFAVPTKIALEVIPWLKESGRVTRSYTGLKPAPLQDLESFYGLDANVGMLIESVDPGSPSDETGLRAGDVILEMNGEVLDVRFPEQMPPVLHTISEFPLGTTINLVVQRNGNRKELEVVTEKLESRVGERWAFEKWGISVEDVSRAYARELQLKNDEGVLVTGVQQAFPAEKSGIGPGDIVLSVNREKVDSLDALKAFYEAYAEEPEKVLLEVWRNHRLSYHVLEPR
ncbi:MAG: trypsin-like peptidase domain-containing protein [Puniceicoccaceae bacterium]